MNPMKGTTMSATSITAEYITMKEVREINEMLEREARIAWLYEQAAKAPTLSNPK